MKEPATIARLKQRSHDPHVNSNPLIPLNKEIRSDIPHCFLQNHLGQLSALAYWAIRVKAADLPEHVHFRKPESQ